MTRYQVGDKVKFLNAIGGGIVVRIEGPVIFVRDDTGFDMPMAASDLIRMADMQGAGKVFNQTFDGIKSDEAAPRHPSPSEEKTREENLTRKLREKFTGHAEDENIEALRDENKRLKSQIENLKDQIRKLQTQLSRHQLNDGKEFKDDFFSKYLIAPGYAEIDLHIEALCDSHGTLSDAEKHDMQLSHFRKCLNYALLNGIKKAVFIHGVGRGILKTEIQRELNQYKQLSYMDAPISKYGVGATEVYFKTITK